MQIAKRGFGRSIAGELVKPGDLFVQRYDKAALLCLRSQDSDGEVDVVLSIVGKVDGLNHLPEFLGVGVLGDGPYTLIDLPVVARPTSFVQAAPANASGSLAVDAEGNLLLGVTVNQGGRSTVLRVNLETGLGSKLPRDAVLYPAWELVHIDEEGTAHQLVEFGVA